MICPLHMRSCGHEKGSSVSITSSEDSGVCYIMLLDRWYMYETFAMPKIHVARMSIEGAISWR